MNDDLIAARDSCDSLRKQLSEAKEEIRLIDELIVETKKQAKINEVRKNRFEIELLRVKLQATERSKEDLCQLTTTLFKNTEFRRSVIQSRSEPILDQQGYMTGNYKDVSVNSFESVAPSKDDGTYDSQGNAL